MPLIPDQAAGVFVEWGLVGAVDVALWLQYAPLVCEKCSRIAPKRFVDIDFVR